MVFANSDRVVAERVANPLRKLGCPSRESQIDQPSRLRYHSTANKLDNRRHVRTCRRPRRQRDFSGSSLAEQVGQDINNRELPLSEPVHIGSRLDVPYSFGRGLFSPRVPNVEFCATLSLQHRRR